jgi:hypothetical protein
MERGTQRLHDLLRRTLFQLDLNGTSQRRRCVLEPMENYSPDSRPPEL